MVSQSSQPFDVRSELGELQTLFRSAADRFPKFRAAFIVDNDGKLLTYSIGNPPDKFDGQIMIVFGPRNEASGAEDLMALCRRGGLVLRHCLQLFPQPNDAIMRDLLCAEGEPDILWLTFLCDKRKPDLSIYKSEQNEQKITRAWFDHFADVSARAVAWLINRYLQYGKKKQPTAGCVFDFQKNILFLKDKPLTLQASEEDLIKALIEKKAATLQALRNVCSNPQKVLAKLLVKNPDLKKYLFLPGRKGQGGYSTTIEAMR
jgi:hypothetical protein